MTPISANDPLAQSANLVAENIAKLKKLFPELVTEAANGTSVNVDVLKQLVGDQTVTEAEEKYGLVWHGKRQSRKFALLPSLGTLRPCPTDSVEWDNTKNVMIEGDNLEVLKALQKSYAGKVSQIYIDPPYNTGKDFVYPDDFKDSLKNYLELTGQSGEGGRRLSTNIESSGRFHTDWLNMMYSRLKVAHSLLRDDGVLFASIDDSESSNLKHLLAEIFGEENYIDTVAVEMSTTSGPKTVNAQQGTIVKNVEFVHIFRKSADFEKVPHTPLFDGIESYDTHYSIWLHEDGSLGSLSEMLLADSLVGADIKKFALMERGAFSINNLNRLLLVSESARQFIEDNLKRIARMDRAPVSAQGHSTKIGHWAAFEVEHRTYYLTTLANGTLQALMPLALNYRMSDDYKPRFGRTVIRGDLWKGFHQDMGNVAKEGEIAFSNGKKPVRLIKQLIKWSSKANDGIVLDFFAGSATTAHAVMELNAEDSGTRRFVVVQLPEPLDPSDAEQKIAAEFCDRINRPRFISEITKERLRRSGAKIKAAKPLFSGDTGFRVFKLDASNLITWDPATAPTAQSLSAFLDHIKPDRSDDDVLYEILLKLGLDLCVPIQTRIISGQQVQAVGGGVLMACLSKAITVEQVEALSHGIVAWHQELKPAADTTCIFRDTAFQNDVAKSNLAAILTQNGIATVRSL